MSKLIDKLGIKPIKCGIGDLVNPIVIKELEQQRNEMLEALIRNLELNQRGYFMKQKLLKDIIEKADPERRSWSEIKELL